MADLNKPLLARATALLAGPFLLGQRALSLVLSADKEGPPSEPAPARISITPPEHAIKRRG